MLRNQLCKATVFLLLGTCFFYACNTPKTEDQTTDTEKKMELPEVKKIVIYQMMTRLFGNKATTNKPYGTLEENGVGKFNDIDNIALQAIKDMGITHVWYTGAIEHAVLTDYTAHGIALDDADVVKGRAGSPYAIKDYYDVNPDMAVEVSNRMQEFEALLQRTHENELRVIIDFVPNHVARHYTSDAKPKGAIDLGADDDTSVAFHPNNNFYYLPGQDFEVPDGYDPLGPENTFPTKDGKFQESPAKATGNGAFAAKPDINDWFETVKINYGIDFQNNWQNHFDSVPDTWNKMRDILLFWTSKGVDGFRCDMAEMVPVEFWHWVIPIIKEANPDIVFIAEIYNPDQYRNYIQNGNFDYLYDKVQLYDTLRNIMAGGSNTDYVGHIQHSLQDINKNMLHFLENHDEQRIASPFFAGDARKGIPGMVVSALVDEGPVMVYFGQEVGEPGAGSEGFSGEDGRTTIFDYWGVPEHQKWMNGGAFDGGQLSDGQKQLRDAYVKLMKLCNTLDAPATGKYIDLNGYNRNADAQNYSDRVNAFMRVTDNEKLLVVTNFDANNTQEATIYLPVESGLSNDTAVTLTDQFMEGKTIQVASGKLNDGIPISIPPLGAYIFKIE
ncbi:MAG: alpha-amylase family glycosyl hydrolase [Bacteroidota bacterium]